MKPILKAMYNTISTIWHSEKETTMENNEDHGLLGVEVRMDEEGNAEDF